MSAAFDALHEQNMAQLGGINQLILGDIKAVSKAQDYAHLAGVVSLEEALGAREVASKVNPGGPAQAS